MQDLNDKITGGTLPAAEWNEVPSELQNVIEALGITLDSGDLNQLGKAIAGYVANGAFYTDSGVADAYVLSVIGLKQTPTAYTNGMGISFIAGNTSTGTSTVNVAALGVKNLKTPDGENIPAGLILQGQLVSARFDGVDFITDSPIAIVGDITINVPADFATPQLALDSLQFRRITGGIATIKIADSTLALTTEIAINHPDGRNINIIGNISTPANVVLQFGGNVNGVIVRDAPALGLLDGVTIDGVDKFIGPRGIDASDGKFLQCGDNVIVKNFWFGVAAIRNGTIFCDNIQVDNAGDVGIWSFSGSFIRAKNASSDNATNGASLGFGFMGEYGGVIDCEGSSATGNNIAGFAGFTGGVLRMPNATSDSNIGDGLLLQNSGTANVAGCILTNNGGFGLCIGDDQSNIRNFPDDLSGNTIADAFRRSDNGYPNYVINGGFRVRQGIATSLSNTHQYGTVDMITAEAVGTVGAGTIRQITPTGFGTTNAGIQLSGVTLSGGSERVSFRYRMEAKDAAQFRGRQFVVSARPFQDTGSTVDAFINISSADVKDDFSSVTLRVSTFSNPDSVPDQTLKTISARVQTPVVDFENGIEIEIFVETGPITTKDIRLYDLILQEGLVRTTWKAVLFEDDLARCQRYFRKTYNSETPQGTVTTLGQLEWIIPVGSNAKSGYNWRFQPMFKTPAVTVFSPNNGASDNLRNVDTSANIAAQTVNFGDSGGIIRATNSVDVNDNDRLDAHAIADARL